MIESFSLDAESDSDWINVCNGVSRRAIRDEGARDHTSDDASRTRQRHSSRRRDGHRVNQSRLNHTGRFSYHDRERRRNARGADSTTEAR